MSSDQPVGRLTTAVLAGWIDRLYEEDRRTIAAELARLASRESVPVLSVLVRDTDCPVQVLAAVALAKLGEPLGLATLETLRHHKLWQYRQLVAGALGRTRVPAALEPLLDMLNDGATDVRISAAKSLGLLGQAAAIPALRQAAERDSHVTVVAYAAEALAKMEEPTDRNVLLRLAQDSNTINQYLGACGLLKLRDPAAVDVLAKITNNKSEPVKRIAAAALCSGTIHVPARLLLAMAQNMSPYVRASTVKALSRLKGQQPSQALLEMADDETGFVLYADDPELFQLPAGAQLKVCAVAAEALASSRSRQSVEKLLRLAESPDRSVTRAATKALASQGQLLDYETVSNWAHDRSEQVRQAAAELLGAKRDPSALDDLLELANDQYTEVRAAALAAMGNVGGSRVLDRLMSGLEEPDWQVQWGAATGLEVMAQQAVDLLIERVNQEADTGQPNPAIWLLDKIGDPVSVRPVITARGTGELAIWQRVVAEAVEAGDRTVMGPLIAALRDGNSRVRENAAAALAALGDRDAVIPLAGLMGDPDWEVRLAAASTLGRIGLSAVDLMAAMLQDSNRSVRAGVANLLGKLQAPAAVDPLIEVLGDPGRLVRANAAEALGRIGDPRAVSSLIHCMQDKDGGVRNNAAAALSRIGTPEALATVEKWTLARRRRAAGLPDGALARHFHAGADHVNGAPDESRDANRARRARRLP